VTAGARVFVVDNYDSFTYNIAQLLGQLGASVEVARHDGFSLGNLEAFDPDAIVISPGPGAPADAGLSPAVVRAFAGRTPLLGVCLGHQCIGEAYGAVVRRASPHHGKTSAVHHDGRGVFAGLAQPLQATRYHSLVVDSATVSDELTVTAQTADGVVMGLRHRRLAVEGVQFHPESVLTSTGGGLMANFLAGLPAPASSRQAVGAVPVQGRTAG
jgi:anthranilate synthase/aminodeoxychorismate synthase-like glutamine amidotransferase